MIKIPGVLWSAVLPELILSGGAMGVLVFGSFFKRKHETLLAIMSIVVLGAAGAGLIPGWGRSILAFDGAIALDGFANVLKVIFLVCAAATILAGHRFLYAERQPAIEFDALVLFSTAGMMLMAAAADLIMVFLALETFSLGLYALVAFRRGRLESQEGALKYFLTGSFSSAFLLYGIALVYGATGSTRLATIADRVSAASFDSDALVLGGLSLILVGLTFKVAAVPFHMWTPDAYEGAPSPVTGFMAAGSKAAGFAVLLRVLLAGFPSHEENWRPIVIAIAIVSMALGSLVAVAQTNIKRMLAYSAIAHSGFLLIGIVASNSRGISGSLFYLGAYAITIIGAFAVVYVLGRPGEGRLELTDYRGLWSKNPFLATVFAVLLVSLAGIPPTAGFWAKFEVFSAAMEAGQELVVVVGVVASAIAAFFYLRIIVFMFLEGDEEWAESERGPATSPALGLVLLTSTALVVVLGIIPGPLLDLATNSTFLIR